MRVLKADGKVENFDTRKLEGTLRRAGASEEVARDIIREVQQKAYDGIPTKKLYKRVLELLEERDSRAGTCYTLKQAVMRLGPAGFPFETYLARVLQEYGYTTRLRQRLEGRCVTHEIDVVAERNGTKVMIEVKFHNSHGIYTDLKEALYTYARFLDLNHGRHDFKEVWLATNTKVSREALAYTQCTGIKVLAWHSPENEGLETMIDRKRLYPITAIHRIRNDTVDAFSRAGLMLMKDLLDRDIDSLREQTGISGKKLRELVREAEMICLG